MDALDISSSATQNIASSATQSTFDSQLAEVTSALGDTTRRGIYLAVRGSSTAMTVAIIADQFGVHPNVARHHLDKLVDEGWLQVTMARTRDRAGPGAGRPAKHYEATNRDVSLQYPARRYQLLAELLVKTLERIDPVRAAETAEEVGREYGAALAADLGLVAGGGFSTTIQTVAETMLGIGFETTQGDDGKSLLTRTCPFGATAQEHPQIVCQLDKGIVGGLLDVLEQPTTVSITPHRNEDDVCVTKL